MITLGTWHHFRSGQLARMRRSTERLRREGISIITELDAEMRLQDIKDEANEWPAKWGGF